MDRQAPPQPGSRSPALDLVIEHEREVSKLHDVKRQRADGAAVGLLTAATGLGALLLTASRGLKNQDVPELAAWAVFATLAATVFAAVLSRATFVAMRMDGELVKAQRAHAAAVQALAECVGDSDGIDRLNASETARLQQAILSTWTSRTRSSDRTLRWQNRLIAGGATALVASVSIMGIIAASVLSNAW